MPVIGCPVCEHRFRVGDLPAGAHVRCDNCGSTLDMPDRPLRKRTTVSGTIGSRSDYIDAEDMAVTRPKRRRDKTAIVLNNAFTVALIVGTTGLTILLLVGGGMLIQKPFARPNPAGGGLAGPVEAPPPRAAEPDPAPVGGAQPAPVVAEKPLAEPAADADAAWTKLVGRWEGRKVERKANGAVRMVARLEFTADRKMTATLTVANGAIAGGDESVETAGHVTSVDLSDGYVVIGVRYTRPKADDDTVYFRFTPDGKLVSVQAPAKPGEPEPGAYTLTRQP